MCFTGETLISTSKGAISLDSLEIGNLVWTRLGLLPVEYIVPKEADVYEFTFSDGTTLFGTEDHPVFLTDGSKKEIGQLTVSDTIYKLDTWQNKSSLMGLFTGKLASTTEQTVRSVAKVVRLFTEKFGNFIKDLFQEVSMFITLTMTKITMTFQTWTAFHPRNITSTMQRQDGVIRKKVKYILLQLEKKQKNGTDQKRVGNGIGNTLVKLLTSFNYFLKSKCNALSVVSHIPLLKDLFADQNTATLTVVRKLYVGKKEVYSVAVKGCSEYFVNGILVSNCDALRYVIMGVDPQVKKIDPIELKKKKLFVESKIYDELQSYKKPNTGINWGD
jgi:hypothetical protein